MWDAAIAAGATLDELQKLDRGDYSHKFCGKLIAWHQLHQLIKTHSEESRIKQAEKEARKKK